MHFPPKRHQEETGTLHDAAAPQVSQEYMTHILQVATKEFQQNSAKRENKKNTEQDISPATNLTGRNVHRPHFPV